MNGNIERMAARQAKWLESEPMSELERSWRVIHSLVVLSGSCQNQIKAGACARHVHECHCKGVQRERHIKLGSCDI
jgi:hypothetical protein